MTPGDQCLGVESPCHLDAAAMSRACEWTRRAIDAGRLSMGDLPRSLRLLVEVLDIGDGAQDTFAEMTPAQLLAFVQAVATWQAGHDLDPDGLAGDKTIARWRSDSARVRFDDIAEAAGHTLARYAPGSNAAKDLARSACGVLGLPLAVADCDGLHHIMRRESGGYVGRPNYTIHLDGDRMSEIERAQDWPQVWDRLRSGDVLDLWPAGFSHSTACGLGQLLSSNMRKLSPIGVEGYGDALAEMCALISYVLVRYRAPGSSAVQAFEDAWRFYNLERFNGPKSERPKWCRYSWRALAKYGGGDIKPGEGY